MTWSRNSHTRSVPAALQRQCFRRDHHTCQHCGYRGTPGDGTLHADHIHNRARGGVHDITNLITLCQPCHADKTQTERDAGIRARRARLTLPQEPHPGARTDHPSPR